MKFPDIPEGHWAEEAVNRITEDDLLTGFPDGEFKGYRTLSRYEQAALLDRVMETVMSRLGGQVVDKVSGTTLTGVVIQVVGPQSKKTSTKDDGTYSIRLKAGTYNVTASAPGYVTQTAQVVV